MSSRDAVRVWDALMERGKPFDIKPAGMLALDVARVEAGLLLIEVDFFSSKKAMIDQQTYTPYEMGLGRLVNLEKSRFIGQRALREEHARGPRRQVVGIELDWTEVERLYEAAGLPPAVAATASRTAVPVYRAGRQIGKATTTTWSPVLKRMIALATVDRPHYAEGTVVQVEVTIEAVRHRVGAKVVATPFYNPPRKTAHAAPREDRRTAVSKSGAQDALAFARMAPCISMISCPTPVRRYPPCPWCSPTIIRSNAYSRSSRFEYGPGRYARDEMPSCDSSQTCQS